MKNKNLKTTPKFTAWLISRLGIDGFSLLALTTGISPHRLTKIKAAPELARYDEARAIACACGLPLQQMITEHRLGRENITLAQADIIAAELRA